MHKADNALMHQKSLASIMEVLIPVLTGIVEDGNAKGIFHCQYPEQYMQIFLASAITLLDDGIFEAAPEKQQQILIALVTLLEKMLGMAEGSLQNKMSSYL